MVHENCGLLGKVKQQSCNSLPRALLQLCGGLSCWETQKSFTKQSHLPQSASNERVWGAGRAGEELAFVPLWGRSSELGAAFVCSHVQEIPALSLAPSFMKGWELQSLECREELGGAGKAARGRSRALLHPLKCHCRCHRRGRRRSSDLVEVWSQSPSPRRSQTSCGCCLALGAVTVTVTAVTHQGGDAASH